MTKLDENPAEESRKTTKPGGTAAGGGHPENLEGADKATKDNDLTTGHSQEGDGGDANSRQKNR